MPHDVDAFLEFRNHCASETGFILISIYPYDPNRRRHRGPHAKGAFRIGCILVSEYPYHPNLKHLHDHMRKRLSDSNLYSP